MGRERAWEHHARPTEALYRRARKSATYQPLHGRSLSSRGPGFRLAGHSENPCEGGIVGLHREDRHAR